ncbi:helix-turn-helix transcriptional regulator [Sphingobium yanoikuyae]|uniref:Helix-turn-helix transcriptional regulator n=1 Tax=Sphingobium yanoikuyae TaxID=13690 RepID=A0AA42WYL3_SPHYA|nr:helix-turn-helix transcriptional regulator [Sphingobium yanoikuyae]MDH2132771.1 helix-turn-helix transcriptional regulator [Sphingobium yanoikuyae]MDH2153166.1 helix-turn-helix transcriptional regulator [Sphingobium yanoikuyae]MDH2168184.1 helix-turn-helix transcriptional regulator [Sphingobium yanoikuyae]
MTETQFDRLTPRECQCLLMVRDLKSSEDIARALNIRPGTVNTYIRDAVVKLGARDRRHAALLYAEHLARIVPPSTTSAPEKIGGDLIGLADQADPAAAVPHAQNAIDRSRPEDGLEGERRSVTPPRGQVNLGLLVREILDGTRPDGMTLATRSLLTLAVAIAIGFCFFAISAGLGMLFSIADFLRRLSH